MPHVCNTSIVFRSVVIQAPRSMTVNSFSKASEQRVSQAREKRLAWRSGFSSQNHYINAGCRVCACSLSAGEDGCWPNCWVLVALVEDHFDSQHSYKWWLPTICNFSSQGSNTTEIRHLHGAHMYLHTTHMRACTHTHIHTHTLTHKRTKSWDQNWGLMEDSAGFPCQSFISLFCHWENLLG